MRLAGCELWAARQPRYWPHRRGRSLGEGRRDRKIESLILLASKARFISGLFNYESKLPLLKFI